MVKEGTGQEVSFPTAGPSAPYLEMRVISIKFIESGDSMRTMDSGKSIDGLDAILDELTSDLMAYWWQMNTKTLVQTIGSQEAVRKLRPYWENSCKAGAYNMRKMTGVTDADAGIIASLWALPRYGYYPIEVKAGNNSSVTTVKDCSIYALCQNDEICQCLCVYGARAYIRELNPDYGLDLVRSKAYGDNDCCWVVKREDGEGMDENECDFKTIPPPAIIDQMFSSLTLALLSQFWIDSTNAFIDAVGRDSASKILNQMMRGLGMKFGSRILEDLNILADNPSVLLKSVERIENFNQREGKVAIDASGNIEKEITNCPLVNSPIEICDQYESFINGICDGLAPSYEFRYDRRMSQGDQVCHWVIQKKDHRETVLSKESTKPHETALELLKKRLVKGEITTEQYLQLKDLIS